MSAQFECRNDVIDYLKSNLLFFDVMSENSTTILQGIGYEPAIYAFIMDGKKLDFRPGTYSYVIFCKIPGQKRLMFASECFTKQENCVAEAKMMLEKAPEFLFEDQYLL